jgi:hypothetical protein
MTSKGVSRTENRRWKLLKDTLEVYGRTAFRQEWKGRQSLCECYDDTYQTDNVVFGRQCRNSDGVTAAPLSRSRYRVPRAKKGFNDGGCTAQSSNPASPGDKTQSRPRRAAQVVSGEKA